MCIRDSNTVDDAPYRILGIDVAGLRRQVSSISASDLGEALGAVKMQDLQRFGKMPDMPAVGDGEPIMCDYTPLCESVMLEELIGRFHGPLVPVRGQPGTRAVGGKIFFVSDDKEWVAVKKMSVLPETTAREVAAFLLGIKASVWGKYSLLRFGGDCTARGAPIAKGKRKGLPALKLAYSESGGDLCTFLGAAALIGYSPTPTADTLKKVFPEIKLPGMRGRKPKG
ncbi:MAG: hypothetical protein N3H30_02410, partial [Candidatus Micrarchaeota archaeon]|nr:hypothetical protein [Candidatus Micrarchaeota archaeon]